jgi:hypothetical protein
MMASKSLKIKLVSVTMVILESSKRRGIKTRMLLHKIFHPIVLPGWQLGHQQTSCSRIPLKWQKPADNNIEHALSQSQYATNHT